MQMSVKRKCLMLSDLQSGSEEIEYVLVADYDALKAEHDRLKKALEDIAASGSEHPWGGPAAFARRVLKDSPPTVAPD